MTMEMLIFFSLKIYHFGKLNPKYKTRTMAAGQSFYAT